jgi:hypothetical protein
MDALALLSICGVACAKDVGNFSYVVSINRSPLEVCGFLLSLVAVAIAANNSGR